MQDHFVKTNDIELHYIQYPNKEKPQLILLHGLTANAHAFDGLVFHGLKDHFELFAPDLRGRGLSTIPAFEYSLEAHAKDILGFLDALKIKKALLCGHSFGGLLSIYLAVHYPERVEKIVLLDAAAQMNENIGEMLMPTLARLDQNYASYADFLKEMKIAPQNTFWEKYMETYYKADVATKPDGTVNPHSNLQNIIAVSMAVANEPWVQHFERVKQAVLLINAVDEYVLDEPLLPDFKAKESVELLQNGKYQEVNGNHFTMNYGENADAVNKAIIEFLT